jgi:hypothetical protein
VYEGRHSVDHNGHIPPLGTLVQKLPNPRTLKGVIVSLEDVHVVADPLLDKSRCEGGS